MDVLSTSVSSLNILTIPSRELSHFKIINPSPKPNHHLLPANPHISSSKNPRPILARSKSIPSPLIAASSQTQLPKHPPSVRQNAATGYAAALLDAARCKNSLAAVERDVRRLSRRIRATGETAVKEVVEKGGFERHLVVLLKMLEKKGKLGIVKGVLDEFQSIYQQLLITGNLVYDS